MKRSSIAALAAILIWPAAMAWPQESLIAQSSFDLFPDALDAAFSAQEHPNMPSFSSLDTNYLFAGLANIDELGSADEATPFQVGWYGKGEHPWMVNLSAYAKTATSTDLRNGVANQVYKDITDTTSSSVTSDYSWLYSELLTNYSFTGAYSAGGTVSFLRTFGPIGPTGPINAGAVLNLNIARGDVDDLDAWMANNVTTVQNYYYNAAGSGVTPPQPLLDYDTTTSISDPQLSDQGELDLPFYFKIGKFASYVRLSLMGSYRDFGSSESVATSVPADATAAYSDVNDSISDLIYSIGTRLAYTLSMPPLIWTDDANETLVSLNFDYRWNTAEDYVSNAQTTSGTATPAGKGDASSLTIASTDTDSERDIPDSLTSDLGFGQSFYFSLANDCYFAIKPWLDVSYAQGPDPSAGIAGLVNDAFVFETTETTVAQTPTSYLKTVETTEYPNADGNGLEHRVKVSFALPTSLKVKPAGWPMSFILSSQSTVTYNLTYLNDTISTPQSVTDTYNAAGTLLSTKTTYPSSISESTSWMDQTWSFDTQNRIGFSLELPCKDQPRSRGQLGRPLRFRGRHAADGSSPAMSALRPRHEPPAAPRAAVFLLALAASAFVCSFSQGDDIACRPSSLGLFGTELDDAFATTPPLLSFDLSGSKRYLVTGIQNPDGLSLSGDGANAPYSIGWADLTARNAWFVQGSFLLKTATDSGAANSTTIPASALHTVAAGSDTYQWADTVNSLYYQEGEASITDASLDAGWNFGLWKLGLSASYSGSRGDFASPLQWLEENRDEWSEIYYNAAADGAVPQPTLDHIELHGAPIPADERRLRAQSAPGLRAQFHGLLVRLPVRRQVVLGDEAELLSGRDRGDLRLRLKLGCRRGHDEYIFVRRPLRIYLHEGRRVASAGSLRLRRLHTGIHHIRGFDRPELRPFGRSDLRVLPERGRDG